MTDIQYKPIEIPDFLIQKIERRCKSKHRSSSISYYIYISLYILVPLLLVIGAIFKIKSLLFTGIILLVTKLLYGWLFVDKPLYGKMFWYVEKQLKQRHIFTENDLAEIWNNSERTAIAQKINAICIKHIGWQDWIVFLPEDSFSLMIKLYTGDLCEVEAIRAIEKEFSLNFPDKYFNEENPGDLKFKDVVVYIEESKKSVHTKN